MFILFLTDEPYVPVDSLFEADVESVQPVNKIEIDPNDVLFDLPKEDYKNLVKNKNDQRPTSITEYNQTTSNPYQRVKDFEKQLHEEFNQNTKQEKNENKIIPISNKNENYSQSQYSKNVMVEFELDGRIPYDNNMWYIRNPGYTCGFESNGTVVIKIKVDNGGIVTDATYDDSKSINANQCMIDKSILYAKKSRFNYKGGSSFKQNGIIIYRFVSQ